MLTNPHPSDKYLSMRGKVRRNRENFYIDLHWEGERLKLYSDKEGNPFYSERQANRALERINSEIDYDEFDPKVYIKSEIKALLWPNYLNAWIEIQKERQEAGGISREYLRMIESLSKHHLQGMFGNKSIRDFKKGFIDDAFRKLPKHLSIKTKYNIQGIFVKIINDALDRDDITKLPKMERITVPEARTTYIEEDVQERILAEIRNPVTLAFFRFCMFHGCRPGEARALKWPDLEGGFVTIAAAMDQDTYRPYTKTKRNRVLPLHPQSIEDIKTLPRVFRCDHIFTLKGKPLRKEYVNMTWRRAAKRAGVSISCYEGTRHSFISQLLNAGYSPALIQEAVGHTNPKTMERYKHIKAESLRPLIDRPQAVRRGENGKGKLLNFQK